MARNEFIELSNAKIGGQRSAVVSKRTDGSYTIGQQLEVEEGKKVIKVFLQGALHISNIEGIQNLRDSLNKVLKDEK